MKNIVVIGGGTGTSVVLSCLSKTQKYNLTAIVVVTDSGGSTGRLVDEFGFLPVGDARQCLAALSSGEFQNEIRDLLLYRFQKGNGLKGHNLGNLILTALEDIYKSPGKAIETAAQIFRINGRVLPITQKKVELVIYYQDGTVKIGEAVLDNPQMGGKKIVKVKLSPNAKLYAKAALAIQKADLVIIGPGDLYASLIPNALVSGFPKTLKQTSAKFLYVVNLMTHFSQTHHMAATQHLKEVIRYSKRTPDYVLVNSGVAPLALQKMYAKAKEYPVVDDLNGLTKVKIIRNNFLSNISFKQDPSDAVKRSLLRHDERILAHTISKLV